MASHGEDASAAKSDGSGDQGERKNAAVSFGFTKTVSKFKSSASDAILNTDERDYLTGIDDNEPRRWVRMLMLASVAPKASHLWIVS